MKKTNLILILLLIILLPNNVLAANKIDNIAIDIYLSANGTADITETWQVDGSDGTEWYKVISDSDNMTLSNFTVAMDGMPLTYKMWDIDESLSEKAGYYGINDNGSGLELCFGKYDYKPHTFTLNYQLTNFVFNTNDYQAIYFKFIEPSDSIELKNFQITISSYQYFPDSIDVWGYGHKGYTYVENGKIKMSNEGKMNNQYVVLLAKFPLNTFSTTSYSSKYDTFDDIYKAAEEGSYKHNYTIDKFSQVILTITGTLLGVGVPVLIIFVIIEMTYSSGYGYAGNKKITKKNTPMFRHIPCNKDIYYANTLIYLNRFNYKATNILGAIILKWVRQNKIRFNNITKGTFNKETSVIDLTLNPVFDNELETNLFKIMYEASKDGILETNELEKWCEKHYNRFLNLFTKVTDNQVSDLKSQKMIYYRKNKQECKYHNVMNEQIYRDSQELYGLKLFLEEFSQINTKEVMEVNIWDEYLMFAYLFGIADKVAKQLKKLYPEVLTQTDIDYDTFIFVSHISTRSVNAASSARQAAQNYNSGGGGFSSGGGGGGSFGGGSIGSR